jgi:hypothetical protein
MTTGNPVDWTHPSTWPWVIYVWLALLLASGIKPLWRRLQQQRAEGWPTTQGKIEEVSIGPKKHFLASMNLQAAEGSPIAGLGYSYTLGGETYRGLWERELGSEEEAREFTHDLEGKSVVVAYNPQRPSKSTLLKDSVTSLLEVRVQAPATVSASSTTTDVPSWVKPLLWPFVILSAVGLGLSLWVHLGAVSGRKVAPEPFFWTLHVGIFVVWLPAVTVANRRVGTFRRNYWTRVLRDSPSWLKYMVYFFFGYAAINFLFFITQTPEKGTAGDTPVGTWRGFSGHWMAFYSAALAILYSAIHSSSESRIEPRPRVRN